MLDRIICIDNVGVFKRGVPKASILKKLTLFYADNARGKSTLSSIMLACANADTLELKDRKTFGATADQKVLLRFAAAGSVEYNSEFSDAGWTGPRPNLHVFNQTFVEENVYAQGDVLPEQRESLLNLALGHAAVAERANYDQLGAAQRDCSAKVSSAEVALTGYRDGLTVDQFINLEPLDDVDARLELVDKEINEARSHVRIAERSSFQTIPVPSFDLSGIEAVLVSSFNTLAIAAEREAKSHFARHNGAATERWVAEGLRHKPNEECPFCGQSTTQVDLIQSYREYFDSAYTNHLKKVNDLQLEVNLRVGNRQLLQWEGALRANQSVAQLWSESLELEALPKVDTETAEATLSAALKTLSHLVEQKVNAPHRSIDVSSIEATKTSLSTLVNQNKSYNDAVEALNDKIASYKRSMAAPNVVALEAERKKLLILKSRHAPETVERVHEYRKALSEYKAIEKAKNAARRELEKVMSQTLLQFQSAINDWLAKFAAAFRVENLGTSYAGGPARSEYALKVRGATVKVGPGGGGDMAFHAALSEGDKRTLAFAFFLAKLFVDPGKADAVIVLDDVFTSLDKHRRHNTIEAVLRMLSECAQVIALGHDAHFLRELKKRATKKGLAESAEFALQRDANDFSYVDGTFDLDDYCSSDYYKHYVLVERYIAADPGVDRLEVAKALRLLIEGHLHRCFPKKFREGQTVGEMLEMVRVATAPNPLVRLQSLRAELVSFNDFASAFHHDTSGGYPRSEVTDAELLPFAQGALGFIQVRSFRP